MACNLLLYRELSTTMSTELQKSDSARSLNCARLTEDTVARYTGISCSEKYTVSLAG